MINLIAIPHHDDYFGNGYYLASEDMDLTWYKGETADEAVENFMHIKKYNEIVCYREVEVE